MMPWRDLRRAINRLPGYDSLLIGLFLAEATQPQRRGLLSQELARGLEYCLLHRLWPIEGRWSNEQMYYKDSISPTATQQQQILPAAIFDQLAEVIRYKYLYGCWYKDQIQALLALSKALPGK